MPQNYISFLESALPKLEWTGITVFFSYFLSQFILFLLQRSLERNKQISTSFSVKKHFSKSVLLLSLVLTLRAVIPFMDLKESLENRIDQFLGVLLIASIAWALARLLSLFTIIVYSRIYVDVGNNLRERKIRTQLQFIEKMILIFIYIVAISLMLMSFEGVRRIGSSLIASTGLAAVALGFAAQKSLANLLAGFQIAFTQPIRIDDVVIVEGEWGTIEEITLTYVVVRIWDKRTLVVPITYFLEKPFQNWTRNSPELLGVVFLYVDYSVPLQELRNQLQKILAQTSLWDGKEWALHVTDSTDRSMQIRLLMGAKDASDAFSLRYLVREQMISYIQKQFPESLPQFRILSLAPTMQSVDEREQLVAQLQT
ncbi:MAG: mechanosensitive ion channel domain-containing protein [Bdellovibrionia bacterium]